MSKKRRNEVLESFTYKGHRVDIQIDENPESPREWGNLGTILYIKGSRHALGDKGVDFYDMSDIVNKPGVISLNVYAYIHGGIALSTTPFSDPWDSGQSGVIYVDGADVLKEFGRKRMTPALRKKVEGVLRSEVEVYGQYVNGEVYGYGIVDEATGETVGSLWGIYGSDYAKKEAKDEIDAITRSPKTRKRSKR